MNQYAIIVRSFVTDSKVIRGGACLGIVLSLICAMFGVFHLSLMIAFMICMGVGQANYNFRAWDASLFIPEMTKKMTMTAIGATVLVWFVVATLVIATNGFSLLWLGVALAFVAGGLWFGSGDEMAQYVYLPVAMLLLFFLMGIVLLATRDFGEQEQVAKWITSLIIDRLSRVEQAIGVIAGWFGVAILFRFWFFSTSRRLDEFDPSLQQTSNDATAEFNPDKSGIDSNLSVEDSKAQSPAVSSNLREKALSRFGRINRLVSQTSFSSTVETRFAVFFLVFASALMLLSRGSEQAMMAMLWFSAAFLIVFPTSVLFGDIPTYFERLWVVGVATDRAATSRRLIQIEARRGLIASGWIIAAILLQFPFEPLLLAAAIVVVITAFGMAGLMLWFVAIRYEFWANMSDAMISLVILLILVLAGFVFGTAVYFDLTFVRLKEMISSIGIIPSLLAAVVASGSFWILAMFEGSKYLARQTKLIE